MATSDPNKAKGFAATVAEMMKAPEDARRLGLTLGWDLVVSYSEDEINRLLHSRFQEIPNVSKIVQFVGLRRRINGKMTRRHYTINFSICPQIKFDTGSATCQLRVKVVAASYAIQEETNPRGQDFPVSHIQRMPFVVVLDGFDLSLVQGIRGGKREDLAGYNADKTINFSENSPYTPWTTLLLPIDNSRPEGVLNVSVLPNPDLNLTPQDLLYLKSDAELLQPDIAAFFQDPRQVEAISYSLSAPDNGDPLQGRAAEFKHFLLMPVSCRFATFKASGRPTGVLSLFIQMEKGKDAGEVTNLQQQWTKQWTANGHDRGPIPEGYSASLILNPEATYATILQPSLNTSSPQWFKTDLEIKHPVPRVGITVYAKTQMTFPVTPAAFDWGSEGHVWYARPQFEDNPVVMEFKQSTPEGDPVCHMNWTLQVDHDWEERSGNVAVGHAKFRTVSKVDHNVPLRFMQNRFQSIMFNTSLDVTQQEFYSHTWTNRDLAVGEKVDNFFGGGGRGMTKEAKDILDHWWFTNLPTLDLGGEFDIYPVTNLLLPGSDVFAVDQDDFAKMPFPLVIVGSVVTP